MLIKVLSAVAPAAPGVASRIAARALFTPRGRRSTPRGDAFLATGVREDLALHGHRIATWRWGSGEHVVLCLHGWAGSAAQFASIAPALVARGCAVIAFDGPGHGKSTGRDSSIIAMRDTLLALAARQPHPVSVIAHSGGAAASTLALADGLSARRLALVGATVDPAALLEQGALLAGFSPMLLNGVKALTERRFGVPWSALRVLPIAATRAEPLIVVHDRYDEEVPASEGVALAQAWPNARLLLTEGLGHRKVLYDRGVATAIADFISEHDHGTSGAAPATHTRAS